MIVTSINIRNQYRTHWQKGRQTDSYIKIHAAKPQSTAPKYIHFPDTVKPEVLDGLSCCDRGNFKVYAEILDSNKVCIKVFGEKGLWYGDLMMLKSIVKALKRCKIASKNIGTWSWYIYIYPNSCFLFRRWLRKIIYSYTTGYSLPWCIWFKCTYLYIKPKVH